MMIWRPKKYIFLRVGIDGLINELKNSASYEVALEFIKIYHWTVLVLDFYISWVVIFWNFRFEDVFNRKFRGPFYDDVIYREDFMLNASEFSLENY